MQPDTITLAVDTLNNGTTTNVLFTRRIEELNKSTYHGPAFTFATNNKLEFYRTWPTRSGTFLGATKTSVKFTQNVSVALSDGTTASYPLIGEVSFSCPVGVTPAQTLELRQRLVALIDRDDIMAPLNDNAST